MQFDIQKKTDPLNLRIGPKFWLIPPTPKVNFGRKGDLGAGHSGEAHNSSQVRYIKKLRPVLTFRIS